MGETVRRSDARVAALTAQGRGFTRAAAARAARAHRRARRRRRAALSEAQRERARRAFRHAVRSSDRSAAAGFPERARSGAGHGAASSLRAIRAARSARRGTSPKGCAFSRLRSARSPWDAGRPKAPSVAARSSCSRRRASSGSRRAPTCWARACASRALRTTTTCASYNRPYSLPGSKLHCYLPRRHAVGSHRLQLLHLARRRRRAELRAGAGAGRAQLQRRRTGHAVLIALDGENAWEYYPFNGYYFLRALYAALADHPLLELTTLSDCVHARPRSRAAEKVVTGSWVHGTLATWMGDPAKNAAWDLLCDAKLAFDRVMREGTLDTSRSAGRRAAARAVRKLGLVLVVRRLQPGRSGEPVRPAVSPPARQPLSPARRAACRRSWTSRSPSAAARPKSGGVMEARD